MDIQKQLVRAILFQHSPKYKAIVDRAIRFGKENSLVECKRELSYLPTEEKLLESLIKKLEGKSVATGVKKIIDGKVSNKFEAAKVYSSLLTHIMIECEHGATEYQLLIESTIGKIYQLLGE